MRIVVEKKNKEWKEKNENIFSFIWKKTNGWKYLFSKSGLYKVASPPEGIKQGVGEEKKEDNAYIRKKKKI